MVNYWFSGHVWHIGTGQCHRSLSITGLEHLYCLESEYIYMYMADQNKNTCSLLQFVTEGHVTSTYLLREYLPMKQCSVAQTTNASLNVISY